MLTYALNIVLFSVLCFFIIALFCRLVNLVSLWCEELTEMVVYRWIGPSGGIFSSSTQVVTLKTLSNTGGNHWYFSSVMCLLSAKMIFGSWFMKFFCKSKSYTL